MANNKWIIEVISNPIINSYKNGNKNPLENQKPGFTFSSLVRTKTKAKNKTRLFDINE